MSSRAQRGTYSLCRETGRPLRGVNGGLAGPEGSGGLSLQADVLLVLRVLQVRRSISEGGVIPSAARDLLTGSRTRPVQKIPRRCAPRDDRVKRPERRCPKKSASFRLRSL